MPIINQAAAISRGELATECRQERTSAKHSISNIGYSGWNYNVCQALTVKECLFSYSGDTVRDCDTRQAFTTIECTFSYLCDTVRDCDTFQTCAVSEYSICNLVDSLWNCNGSQTLTIYEGIRADISDAIGYSDT